MTDAQKAVCVAWVKAHAHKWQVLNRAQWKYQFHEKTLVRFVEETQMREDEISLILEYLSSDDCIETLSLYDQTVDDSWKPTRAWLEIANKSVGSVHSVRLYHGLQTEVSALSDGPYLITDGCAYKVSMTYYWRQSSVEEVPPSESGVSYSITGLSRDADTGLYTYAIEKRERVQQDVAEYLTAKTAFSTTTEEYHLGVKQSDVASTGQQASVENGKVVRRKITKNQDCTSDVHNTTETEQKVKGASESVSVSLTGTTKTTVNRNMPEKASTEDLDVGDRVENTETEGGLWNQTITKRVKSALTWLASTCRWTVFAHSHTDSTVQGTDPGFTHTTKASGGVIVDKKVSRTADGSYEVSTSTTTEQAVPSASETTSVGLDGTTVTTVNRNMPEKAAAPTEIGESVENSETEGGLWNQTIRKLALNAVTKISDACRKTIFAHSHSTESVQSAKPDFTDVDEASGGVIHRKSVTRTSTGAYRVSDDTTTEQSVVSSSRTATMTLNGLSVSVENRNQSAPLNDPTEIGDSVTNTKTEGGLYNTVEKMAARVGAGTVGESCKDTYYEHEHSTTKNTADAVKADTTFVKGSVTRRQVAKTDNGTSNVTESTVTTKKTLNAYHYTDSRGTHYVVKYTGYDEEYDGIPSDASTSNLNDTVGEDGLHSGTATWSYTTSSGGGGGSSFVKHGKKVKRYVIRYMGKRNLRYCSSCDYQLVWHYGDAYTDCISDIMNADPSRGEGSDDSTGVVAAKLINKWTDKAGNVLAEWKSVEKCGAWSGFERCKDTHGIGFGSDNLEDIINTLLK